MVKIGTNITMGVFVRPAYHKYKRRSWEYWMNIPESELEGEIKTESERQIS